VLTKDLLQYRILKGQVRPRFIDPARPELLALADALCAVPAVGIGADRASLEEQLAACHAGFQPQKLAEGLVKLVLDRMTFEEPSDEAAQLRVESFTAATRLLRALPDDATQEQYEQQLATGLARPLEGIREALYGDHPENRRLIEWKPIGAQQLLERYNLALVQGLVMKARRVEVRALAPDLLRVRRVLRWLKFCRLVADVKPEGNDWTIDVEGPAEILSMAKKYGLQLASFVGVVPVLGRYELSAEVVLGRGKPVLLQLDERSGLVSPHDVTLGYIPPEIEVIVKKLDGGPWETDLTPTPRPVGAGGLCVPDLTCRHRTSGVAVSFEFFHPWHRHALVRRLEELRQRADAQLILAVDEQLLGEPELRAEVEAHAQTMLFRGFPSERKIRGILERFVGD
jgi:predicted nuclease of restriction endonuclease-like RecB superfamily